jgi:hypothetical protein
MSNIYELILKSSAFLGAFVIVVMFSALLSYPYMLLWNKCLVPAIVGLKEVEWIQMWGITILAHGLFKSTSK